MAERASLINWRERGSSPCTASSFNIKPVELHGDDAVEWFTEQGGCLSGRNRLSKPTLAKPTWAKVEVLVVCEDFGFWELIVWVFLKLIV